MDSARSCCAQGFRWVKFAVLCQDVMYACRQQSESVLLSTWGATLVRAMQLLRRLLRRVARRQWRMLRRFGIGRWPFY